jgi:hypothetical protein
MKVISYSLWGSSPLYNAGAVRNAEIALELYPGWMCWFYAGSCVPKATLEALERMPNTRIVRMAEPGGFQSLFWRFFPASDPSVEVMISRDCDSRPEVREAAAVADFLRSDRSFHIMRDHPWHNVPILGGMFGAKHPAFAEMEPAVRQSEEYRPENARRGSDQEFLARAVWPKVRDSCLIHDEFHSPEKWPIRRHGVRFVGQAFNEEDLPLYPEHSQVLSPPDQGTYRIDLREVPILMVSGRRFAERRKRLKAELHERALKPPLVFEDELPGRYLSVTQNHLSAISTFPPPFLVIEDDAAFAEDQPFHPLIDVPVTADAIYLGTSVWGMVGDSSVPGGVRAAGSKDLPRVFNMQGLHAVLYLNARYVSAIKDRLYLLLVERSQEALDIFIARMQADWNVFAMQPPAFFQSDGWNAHATTVPLLVEEQETFASPDRHHPEGGAHAIIRGEGTSGLVVCSGHAGDRPVTPFQTRQRLARTLFVVLTCDNYIHTRVAAIQRTWGRDVNIVYLSDAPRSDSIIGYNTPRNYDGIQAKYTQFFRNFDFSKFEKCFFVDDDTFINLRTYCSISLPESNFCLCHRIYLGVNGEDADGVMTGCDFSKFGGIGSELPLHYPSGGSGFLMDVASVEKVQRLLRSLPENEIPRSGYSDVTVGFWMRLVGIDLINSPLLHYSHPAVFSHTPPEIRENLSYHYVDPVMMEELDRICARA